MRASTPLFLFLFLLSLVFSACGDDTSTGGSPSTGGNPSEGGGGNPSEGGGGSRPEGGGGASQGGGGAAQGGGGASQGGGGSGQGGMAQGGGGAGQGGTGGDGGAGGGGMMLTPSEQIAAVLATPDGGGLTLPIEGALVTYTKPMIGTDPAGFFLQADQAGPALFVAVDPTTLTPALVVGDEVDLTVTDVATVTGLKQATAITGLSRTSQGNPIAPLVTDISTATDLVTDLDAYAGRVISFSTAEIDAPFTSAGAPQVAAKLLTVGMDDVDVRFRLPETVRAQYDLQQGCLLDVDYGVMWRFNAVAQPSVVNAADIVDVACDAPTVMSAIAASQTSVVVTFSRQIDPASVMANGSQFTFSNGLTASAAVASGNTVTVTTSAQTPGAGYMVTVAASVEDTLGAALGMPDNASFSGYLTQAVVRINELNARINQGCDLIELRVVSGGTMNGYTLTERVTTVFTFPDIVVATNDIVVVHFDSADTTNCNPSAHANETTGIAQLTGGGNFDTAWDMYSTDTGLTDTDNTLQLKDALGTILDAVLIADDPTGTAAADSETAAAAVAAAMQWVMLGGGIPAGGFVDDAFCANAVLDSNATGTDRSGDSLRRIDNTDDHDEADWAQGASTWGLINAGQTAF